jgi:hypothetical protein
MFWKLDLGWEIPRKLNNIKPYSQNRTQIPTITTSTFHFFNANTIVPNLKWGHHGTGRFETPYSQMNCNLTVKIGLPTL